VVDLSWPYAADLDCCDQFLAYSPLAPLPVVVLAAHPTDADLTARRTLVTVTKPLNLDTLVSVIRFLVQPTGPPRADPG
jgi:hypothetical protein